MRKLILPSHGRPNANNRVYHRDAIEKMLTKFKESHDPPEVFGTLGYSGEAEVRADLIALRATNLEMGSEGLTAEVEVLDTPQGKMLKTLLEDNQQGYVFRTAALGQVSKTGEVTELELTHIAAISAKDDAFATG